jgi:WhiB family transcriptional regulator, redox-sensing transcriptional regulator
VRNGRWQDRAACRGADVELFFPSDEAVAAAALEYCTRCTVRAACLAFAMSVREPHGVWGGTTEVERRRVFRRRARSQQDSSAA